MLELNFYTVYNVSKIAPKLMENSSNSSIINIITPYAEIPVEGTSLYSSSKAALMNFSRSLALEFRVHKIRVNSLMCNTIDTKLNRKLMPKENFDAWTKPEEIFDTMSIICILYKSPSPRDE